MRMLRGDVTEKEAIEEWGQGSRVSAEGTLMDAEGKAGTESNGTYMSLHAVLFGAASVHEEAAGLRC